MVSTEKGSGKIFGERPNSGDEKMMTQGLREMNLHVYDFDDWLVINKETNVRAMNDPRVAPNPTHRARGQPAMLGRLRTGEQVPWSNFHTPNAGVMCRPPDFMNYNQNGMVMGKLVGQPPLRNGWGANGFGDHMNSYAGMPLKNTGCVTPVIVIDSSDDEEEGDYSGGDNYVTDRKARIKGVSQGLTSDSWGHPGAIPGPYMNRVKPPSDVLRPAFGNHGRSSAGRGVIPQPGTRPCPYPPRWDPLPHPSRCGWEFNKNGQRISKVKSNDGGFSTEDDDDFCDEDVDWEDDVTQANGSHQSRRPVHGQVGVDLPLNKNGNFTVQRAVQSPAGRGVISQPGTHPVPHPSRCGWEFSKNGKSISKVKCNDGGFSTEDDGDYSDEDVDWEDDVTRANWSHQSRRSVHGQVGVDLPLNAHSSFTVQRGIHIPMGVVLPPNQNHSWNVAAGIGPSQAEAARHRGKAKVCCNSFDVNGIKSTQSHDDAKEQFLKRASRQKYQQYPGTVEGILPGVSNPISGANSCKMSATSGGLKREILSEAESSDFDDEEDSQFDDNECDELESRLAAESFKRKSERLGTNYEPKTPESRISRLLAWQMKQKCEGLGTKDELESKLVAESFKKKCESSGKLEENCYVRQSSKFKEGEKEKKQSDSKHVAGQSVTPPLQQGWKWAAKSGSSEVSEEKASGDEKAMNDSEEDDYDYTDDEDDLLCGDSDSDEEGPETHDTMKNHRMLKQFFENLDTLSVQEINKPERQWHCPACHGGPGAIDWYKGLQPLMTHARTKGSQRVKLHRTFADVLDEELRRRGTSVVPAGESFGHWEGLKQDIKDHDIVWPPMVVVMNTILDKDDNDKWLGMGNQELLDYFRGYAAVRAKHSYGPKGHRGFSVLIFESSAVGYAEAERLHRHFQGQGTGRPAWESNRKALFYPGGKRQLYGFLARKDDLDEFNKHCPGKTKLKFEIRSYQEMVVAPMKQMSEDNQQLTWFKNKAAKGQRQKKALEESFNIVTEKLRKTMEENRIVRQRTKLQHEENKEEMDFQAQFFKDQIQQIHDATDAKEDHFEKLQQEERMKIEVSKAPGSNMDDVRSRAEEVMKSKELQDKEIGKFVAEREQLIQNHKGKQLEMKKRHWEEELELEKEFDAALTKLMENYAPDGAAITSGNA